MPTDKDFKRLVRGRMQKTGESYTAARANLIRRTDGQAGRRTGLNPCHRPPCPHCPPPVARDYAKLAA